MNNLAVLYQDQNKFDLAEKYYLLSIENKNIDSINNLAMLYKDQNKFDLAEKYYLLSIENKNINSINNLSKKIIKN